MGVAWASRVARFCKVHGLITTAAITRMAKTRAYREAKEQYGAGASDEVVHMALIEAMAQAGLDHDKAKPPPKRRE